MKKILTGILVAVCAVGLVACKPGQKKTAAEMEKEWYRYISAYTYGTIPRKSEVRVLFVNNAATPGQSADGLLEFSPSIPGKAEWKSLRELVFTPKGELKPGQGYKAVLHVGRVLKLPKAFAEFRFTFGVIKPEMEIFVEGLSAEDPARPEKQVLKGQINTADAEEPALVEKVLEADQQGRKLTVEWSHALGGASHDFTAKGVERREVPSEVRLTWDGAPLRIDNRGYRAVTVPALGQFELVGAEAAGEQTRHVVLRFSDPLAKDQNLQGLIRIENRPLTFEIDGNVVRVYSTKEVMGTVTVMVSAGIRNASGRRLARGETRQVTFESIRPQVRFVGKGVILPKKDRLTVPIEAVNLRAVQVAALQVYGNNIAQFLQVNDLEGSAELARVGRFLWRRTITLSDDPEVTGRWSRYELDVTPLFRESPGSIFRLVVTFNRGNSTYPCPGSSESIVTEPEPKNVDDSNESYWDIFSGGYEYNYRDWARRNDPCSDAYYNLHMNPQAVAGRNFIASNVGLTAKLDENLTLRVVATDIGSARPLSGARVRVYSFQNQLLGEASTDGNGFAVLKLGSKPFYVAAQAGDDVGYLRLNGDAALPLGHFDVGGEAVQKGIKGVVYGERGVWRPGDTLYLTFALFDRERVLPAGHPVVMEVYSPQGQLVQTLKPEKVVEPFYAFRFVSDETAPTGNWQARVLVGGLTFSKTLKIETVVPNRLKVDFKTGRDLLTRKDVPFEASLASQWLHGAPAANLKFDVTVRLSPRPTRFEKYPNYTFDDPASEFAGGEVVTEKGVLDARGLGKVKLDFAPKQPSPGVLDATFVTRVFEEGGDFSIDSFTQPYHPYDSYVGLLAPRGDETRGMLLTDVDHTVDIVTLEPSGRPVARAKLKVSLYKIDWKWWWDKSGDSLAQYVSSPQTRPLLSAEVATPGGAGKWNFQIKYPDWGRFLIRVEDPESGHAAGRVVYIDWPGWAGRSREEAGAGAGATRLNFTSDKARYRVGEKAVIFLPEAVQGRALVSLESGSTVLDMMWVSTEKGENRFEVPLTDKMAPNVYVHVTLLQPHSGKVSDTPIRLYGVIPLIVDDPSTRLEPVVGVADEVKPKEKFKVQVREKSRRPMTYTLAVVDEGLLGLTRYSVPDLRNDFCAREALGVVTWDLFDEVVEAYGAELSRILALGGGEAGTDKDKARKPRRFPPVVLFDGPFELKAGDTATHELEMPQYFGAVRVMVVAGRDGAFGSAEKSVIVRRDLMALPTLPRVVRPGEEVSMPITVFVTNPALKSVEVGLDTNAMFQVVGERSKTVPFDQPGDRIVSFTLKTAGTVGQGEVRFRVASGAEKTEDSVFVPVQGSNPLVTQTTRFEVGPGRTLRQAVTPFGLEGTNTVTVEASPLPPLNLEKRLDFLIQYPHGCLEQTLSAAFPQLYLKDLVRLDEKQRKDVQDHVDAAIDKMGQFQMPNGGFSYWPGWHEAHEWTSAFAGWFLLEASRLGYRVPPSMLDKWKANQKMLANGWTTGELYQQLTQAFRLFALALARDPDLGAMNRLRETEGLDGSAALMLAAAFQVAGQTDAAADLAKRADLKFPRYRDDTWTFGSDFRDEALAVRCLVQVGRSDRAKLLVDGMTKVMGSDEWLSTHETAFALMALSSFYGGSEVKPFRYRIAWDADAPRDVESSVPFDSQVFDKFPAAGRTLVLTNTEAVPLYVTVFRRGLPAAGEEPASANDLAIEVTYRDMKMNPIDIAEVSQGLDIVADIRVKNPTQRALNNLVLTHLVAAGFQIKNPRFTGGAASAASVDYQDIRDDRVFTYFSLSPGQDKTFLVVLNASYQGRFYQPGIAAEAMYDASVHANTKGQWVKIVP